MKPVRTKVGVARLTQRIIKAAMAAHPKQVDITYTANVIENEKPRGFWVSAYVFVSLEKVNRIHEG